MERSIRIGKDFNVRWSINKRVDGERQPYELAGKELVLQYRTPYGLKEATEWKVVGNTIVWTFRGKEQKALGSYELILTENGGKDGMVTVDTCRAFKLVAHSCEETEGSGSDIVIEDVVFESEVAFAALRGPQGERGPEGPQGPQGERGPQGEQGPAGPSYNDTEIKAKLTELSEGISGLSEGKEDKSNKTTAISEASTDTQYPSARATFMAISKKSEVSLEALANGNLKVTIDGVSKDFMAATPSGDPMHYNYITVGAEYNDTDAPIAKTDYFGNAVSHLPGRWYMEGLGDVTNAEMREIYEAGKWWENLNNTGMASSSKARAILPSLAYEPIFYRGNYIFTQAFNSAPNLEVIDLRNRPTQLSTPQFNRVKITNMDFACQGANKVKYIYGIIDASVAIGDSAFWIHTSGLVEVRLYNIKRAVKLPISNRISKASILYMIENEAATSNLVITLHADAYARLSADADIVAALAAHPKVSLAKA